MPTIIKSVTTGKRFEVTVESSEVVRHVRTYIVDAAKGDHAIDAARAAHRRSFPSPTHMLGAATARQIEDVEAQPSTALSAWVHASPMPRTQP